MLQSVSTPEIQSLNPAMDPVINESNYHVLLNLERFKWCERGRDWPILKIGTIGMKLLYTEKIGLVFEAEV